MQLYYTKLMKVMKEGIYIGAEYYNPMVLGDHVYFETLCTMTTVTQWKVLKQGVHCILLIDRYILICFGKGIERVRRYYGWKVLVNPLSLTLCWLGTT
jgi:hypothetical protein